MAGLLDFYPTWRSWLTILIPPLRQLSQYRFELEGKSILKNIDKGCLSPKNPKKEIVFTWVEAYNIIDVCFSFYLVHVMTAREQVTEKKLDGVIIP